MITCFDKENNELCSYESEEAFRGGLKVFSPVFRDKIDRISLSKDLRIINGNGLFSYLKITKIDHYPENFKKCAVFSRMFYGCPNLNCDLVFDSRKAKHLYQFLSYCDSFDSKIVFVNKHESEIFGILDSLPESGVLSLEKKFDYYKQFSDNNYNNDIQKDVILFLEKEIIKKKMFNEI